MIVPFNNWTFVLRWLLHFFPEIVSKYSEGLNTKNIGKPNVLEVQISNGWVLEWSVKEIAIAIIVLTLRKLNHCKSKQNGGHFVQN